MKALVYEGPRTLAIRTQPVPSPGRGEVLVRVARAGICGSELGGYLGHNSLRKPPLVMGHEFAGTIEQVGPGSSRLQGGERVTANPLVTCGACRACRNGAPQLCAERKLIGAHLPGAFAEYVVVPERNAFVLDDHITFDEGAYTEPFACALHIVNRLNLRPDCRLLIMGAGPIGLLTLQAARIYGLQDIVVVDINEERLAIAGELHAATATRIGDEERRTFDAAVDAVGMEATRAACMQAVREGGAVVFSGLHEDSSRLQVNEMIRSEIRVSGAFAYSQDEFEAALYWIGRGKVRLAPWTGIAPLEEGGACFEKLIGNPGKTAKILLTTDG